MVKVHMQSFVCKCPERKKPVGSRRWVVRQRKFRRLTPGLGGKYKSDYSMLQCLACGVYGRTKAQYVEKIKDAGEEGLVKQK